MQPDQAGDHDREVELADEGLGGAQASCGGLVRMDLAIAQRGQGGEAEYISDERRSLPEACVHVTGT